MFGKKKKHPGLHVTPKAPRARGEIDRDYSTQALNYGHKMRLITQFDQQIKTLEKECEDHLEAMIRLNAEGLALPPEPQTAPTPAEGAQA